MKKIFYITTLMTMLSTTTVYPQLWEMQNSGTNNSILNIEFINANTGFAVCDSFLLKTTNSGANWIAVPVDFPRYLSKIVFLNSSTGFLINRTGSSNNTVYRTTDGGNNWNINYQHQYPFVDIAKADSTSLSIGTAFRQVIKTTNSGDNWITYQINSTLAEVVYNVSFSNRTTGYLTSVQLYSAPPPVFKGLVLKTTDGGLSWYSKDIQIGSSIFVEQQDMVSFAANDEKQDDTVLYINNQGSQIHRTTNTGTNWYVTDVTGTQLRQFSFINSSTGWACGTNGIIYKTIDGASVWTHTSTVTSNALNTICFVNALTGWAAGDGGVIIKTTSGGITFLTNENSNLPKSFSLSQNYPNPFNPTTNIKFDIPKAGLIKLTVFDVIGREIQTLVNEQLSSGSYNYDFDASNLTSGIYYYKLESNEFTKTKKMVLIK